MNPQQNIIQMESENVFNVVFYFIFCLSSTQK